MEKPPIYLKEGWPLLGVGIFSFPLPPTIIAGRRGERRGIFFKLGCREI